MNLNDAISLDRQGDLKGASLAYEDVLKEDPGQYVALVNLIVMYWQMTDFGFLSGNNISPDFVHHASKRLRYIINHDSNPIFNPDYIFWKKYIAWADLGAEFDLEECRRLLRIEPDYLEPAMFIFSVSGGRECEVEARILLKRCVAEGTVRAKYVESVLRGTMQRRDLMDGGKN